MRAPATLVVLLLLAGTALGQKIGEVPRTEPSAKAPRGEVLEWTTPEGQEYWYRLPKKAGGRRKPCLVLMLHGTGLNHGWSFWNYPIKTGEFRGDDIVVSPDGLTPGNGDTFNFVQGKKDGEQIANLIGFFRKRFEISNVYLYGHSQGAFFCYWFAGEHPELVNGIVAHAGNVLDVRHTKLAKSRVAIGILHARSDQVVPVSCAERTEKIYREEGYQKVKCWIVEDIRPDAGHWPLPPHVTEMFEWLDAVSTSDAAMAVEVARSALRADEPDFALAVRAAADARSGLKAYKGDDKEQVAGLVDALDAALACCAEAAWQKISGRVAEHDNGKTGGAYAADVRWTRAAFGELESFGKTTRPLASIFKKHDKALEKAGKVKDREGKKYARALVTALEDGYLASGWDTLLAQAKQRVEAGWNPVEDLKATLETLASELGSTPSEDVTGAAADALSAYSEAHPELLAEE